MPERKEVTRPLPDIDIDTGQLQPAAVKKDSTTVASVAWSVRFHIEDDEILLNLETGETALIGRSDENHKPEIDLMPFNAIAKGVSRRHATVTASDGFLLVSDLGSTNGSFLNGHRLSADTPYRLHHGDTLQVGMIYMKVEFALVPVHEGIVKKQGGTGTQASIDEEEAQELASRPLLIVEDDRDVAQLLADLLDTLGYQAVQVHRVADAMRHIAQQLPRAVLLDLKMPDYDGIEVIQMLRQDMATRHLPIMVISGASNTEDVEKVLVAGADVFLSKPIGMNELLDALRQFVG